MDWDATRPGETECALPDARDAGLLFIGVIRTPFTTRDDCPRQGRRDGPICRIELRPEFHPALLGIDAYPRLEVLYWMHRARRDLLTQSPKSDRQIYGTFALRSPVRPNPIATSIVELVAIEPDGVLLVRGLDCLDGTPLLDVKPDRACFVPKAPPCLADRA
jgi:tRNA-Thr(GGU) m(6)t(6)A37 methyltransferase TsaA